MEILKIEGLCKSFELPCTLLARIKNWFGRGKLPFLRALNNVTFSAYSEETLGILGESGSGKSTLARVLMGIITPDSGKANLAGDDLFASSAKMRLNNLRRMQMVFQDPFSSLDPRQSIFQILAEPLRIHGISPKEGLKNKIAAVLNEVGLETGILDRYPAEFSGGQRQRICISRALLLDPEILIADEAVSALDVSVQAQILELFVSLKKKRGLTLIFISHDVAVIRQLSDRILVFFKGAPVEIMPSDCLLSDAVHPYSKNLLKDALHLREGITGNTEASEFSVKNRSDLSSGCAFFNRCNDSDDKCLNSAAPVLSEIHTGHFAACWKVKK
ncbi:MAG: ABC transporter ATP-binding protein [Candidatus Riflebacteria bacterium]|nr:ABC transporter ATP-binding protein [Candidatus Riflebacteria bacterium]